MFEKEKISKKKLLSIAQIAEMSKVDLFKIVPSSLRRFVVSSTGMGFSLGIGLFSPELMRRYPSSAHNFIADIAKKALPAVVFIEIKGG